jgi:hypothetical protein
MGRPTIFTPDVITNSQEYLNRCLDYTIGNVTHVKLPTKGGLAVYLGINRDTLYEWGKANAEFSDILEQIMAIQEDRLVNNGLAGTYNPTIAKLLLASKHEYVEKTESKIDSTVTTTSADVLAIAAKAAELLKEQKT